MTVLPPRMGDICEKRRRIKASALWGPVLREIPPSNSFQNIQISPFPLHQNSLLSFAPLLSSPIHSTLNGGNRTPSSAIEGVAGSRGIFFLPIVFTCIHHITAKKHFPTSLDTDTEAMECEGVFCFRRRYFYLYHWPFSPQLPPLQREKKSALRTRSNPYVLNPS